MEVLVWFRFSVEIIGIVIGTLAPAMKRLEHFLLQANSTAVIVGYNPRVLFIFHWTTNKTFQFLFDWNRCFLVVFTVEEEHLLLILCSSMTSTVYKQCERGTGCRKLSFKLEDFHVRLFQFFMGRIYVDPHVLLFDTHPGSDFQDGEIVSLRCSEIPECFAIRQQLSQFAVKLG